MKLICLKCTKKKCFFVHFSQIYINSQKKLTFSSYKIIISIVNLPFLALSLLSFKLYHKNITRIGKNRKDVCVYEKRVYGVGMHCCKF